MSVHGNLLFISRADSWPSGCGAQGVSGTMGAERFAVSTSSTSGALTRWQVAAVPQTCRGSPHLVIDPRTQ
jgi:hypothetical protein